MRILAILVDILQFEFLESRNPTAASLSWNFYMTHHHIFLSIWADEWQTMDAFYLATDKRPIATLACLPMWTGLGDSNYTSDSKLLFNLYFTNFFLHFLDLCCTVSVRRFCKLLRTFRFEFLNFRCNEHSSGSWKLKISSREIMLFW